MNTAEWALLLGAIGTLTSLILMVVKLLEVFFLKPSFRADFRWSLNSEGVLDGASLVIMNLGRTKGGVLRIGFTGPHTTDHHVWPVQVYEQFPIVLDVNDVTERFNFDLTTFDDVALGLRDGELTTLTIVDLNNEETRQPLPSRPDPSA